MMTWELLRPRMTITHLGFLPGFLDEDDPRPAAEQFNERYLGGWRPFDGFKLSAENNLTSDEPTLTPLAKTWLRDEEIFLYRHDWVVIKQPDGSWQVSRMD